MPLSELMSGHVFGYLLVLSRLGTAMMFMPGFGEQYVPTRPKVLLILTFCLVIYPATPAVGMYPDGLPMIFRLMMVEVTIGLWIGVMARTLMTALQFAGYQVGMVSALANAFANDTGSFQGSTMLAQFLLITGLALIFITNTHHVMLEALLSSYNTFPLGHLETGDMTEQGVKMTSYSIYLGMSLAAPFYVLGVLNNVGLGLANRMMPTLPVFFVASSLLIFSGITVFAVAAPNMLMSWLPIFARWFGSFEL
jgi:flagellar biosynthesis protein FliR